MVVLDEKPPMLPPPPPYSSATAYSVQAPPTDPNSPSRFASRNPFRHASTAGAGSSAASPPNSPLPKPTSEASVVRGSGSGSGSREGRRRVPPLTFTMLPSHLLLEIVYHTFPQASWMDEGRVERQRKTLYWLSVSLRLVNRAFYVACMHVLRSTYLPAYTSLVRHPYTSDPFPQSAPPYSFCAISAEAASPTHPTSPYTSLPHRSPPHSSPPSPSPSTTSLSSTSSHSHSHSHSNQHPHTPHTTTNGIEITGPLLPSLQRETSILDMFIALKVREDVWSDDTELHLEREESFRDLFDFGQPRARLEDLVRGGGVRKGCIYVGGSGAGAGAGAGSAGGTGKMVEWGRLSVAFSSRKVGLVLSPSAGAGGRKRTVVEVERTREERLEVAARRLVRGLREWLGGA